MGNTPLEQIDAIVAAQKDYFASGATLPISYRKSQLKALLIAIQKWEKPLCEALWTDLHKSYEESYITETSIVMAEIRTAIKKVKRWSRKELKPATLSVMPSMSYVVKEPLGNALIISPWNYPIQLLLTPLIGAIAAGCTAILKPSPYVPHVSEVIGRLVADTFEERYIAVVQGNRVVNGHLLDKHFDIIFYTGSPAVGRTVMEAAAKNLTPVVLELGGKSPCIIDRTANIDIAAKRLAWGKTLNSGQTCVAPDYILIHREVKEAFIKAFEKQLHELHGADIKESGHYVRMVSDKAFERVSSYLNNGRIVCGGHTDASSRYIEPTLIDEVSTDAPIMNEEIFGPIFPMITLEGDSNTFAHQVTRFVNSRPKPLAMYYFGKKSDGWKIIRRTSSGGACINDNIMHLVNTYMPFGGVGNSGMGSYHHKESFEAFSHRRSVLISPKNFDLPLRYMPYKLFGLIKKII